MNQNFRNLALWAVIGLLLIALFNLFSSPQQSTASREIPYSQFLEQVEQGRVKSVTITGDQIIGTLASLSPPIRRATRNSFRVYRKRALRLPPGL
jgi:cell division protease FtsH